MAQHFSPRIILDGLVFLIDPADRNCYNGTSSLVDIIGGKTMTVGSNTVSGNTYGNGLTHFSSNAGEAGSGGLDTGYRYGGSTDKVVSSSSPWTVGIWIYRSGAAFPNNWWHLITDGNSGDILTLNESGNFLTSMNNPGLGGSFTSGSDIDYGFTYSNTNYGWNFYVLMYDLPQQRLKLVLNNVHGSWQNGRVIDPTYRIRNFVGWGSAQSSYHSDPSHSICFAYQRVLTDTEITYLYNIQKGRFI
jgi:hypothetical protein